MLRKTFKAAVAALAFAGLTACATAEQSAPTPAIEPASLQMFEVHHDNGRIYVFDSFELYKETAAGKTPLFHRTRIGGGPEGKTLVFGLNGDQSKKTGDIDFIQIFDGKAPASDNFYGEMRKDGRLYVFESLQDMHAARTSKPIFFVNMIGGGPEGQTVFFVQNSKTSGKPADSMMARYNAMNAKK
jgi:hypothetical protein